MKQVVMFQCEHCNKKRYVHKTSAKRHEKDCYWNPTTKSCMSCQNYMNPDMKTDYKIVEENTICLYADEYKGFSKNCRKWREIDFSVGRVE